MTQQLKLKPASNPILYLCLQQFNWHCPFPFFLWELGCRWLRKTQSWCQDRASGRHAAHHELVYGSSWWTEILSKCVSHRVFPSVLCPARTLPFSSCPKGWCEKETATGNGELCISQHIFRIGQRAECGNPLEAGPSHEPAEIVLK